MQPGTTTFLTGLNPVTQHLRQIFGYVGCFRRSSYEGQYGSSWRRRGCLVARPDLLGGSVPVTLASAMFCEFGGATSALAVESDDGWSGNGCCEISASPIPPPPVAKGLLHRKNLRCRTRIRMDSVRIQYRRRRLLTMTPYIVNSFDVGS